MKVYVENNNSQIERMFEQNGYECVNDIFSSDLLCLDGGADVSPEIYGHTNIHSYSDIDLDQQSFGLIALAEWLNIPVVGICRGAQVMCVYNGGVLNQHIEGHHGPVSVDIRGVIYQMPCDHHQECIPDLDERDIYRSEDGCAEVMIYRDMFMLGWQPHPEYVGKNSPAQKIFFSVLKEVCFGSS